jgi:capsular polysaccharide transport system permease protein
MSFARGLWSQFEVVHALALRETRTRFGAHQLGYLWALVEPTLLIATFLALFAIVGRSAPDGMSLFGFLATGMVPYLLFVNSANRVAEAINANRALLFYPQVRPLDLVFARGLLELATYVAVFLVLMGAEALVLQRLVVAEPLLVVAGFAMAGLLGSTVGLVFCGVGQYTAAAHRARGPMLRPLFWTSGIFFTAAQLPEVARAVLLWNPLLHVVELTRAGWYPGQDAGYASVGYVLAWVLGFALAGLALERVGRRRIEVT